MAEASRLQGHPNAAPSSSEPEKLVDFARQQGYRVDELIEIIEDVA